MQKLMNSGIEVIFVKVDSHTGDLFNELVDEKCKEVLRISSDRAVEKLLKKNIIEVSSYEVKNQILSIAPASDNHIIVNGSDNKNEILDKIIEQNCEESDEKIRFEEIVNLYKNNHKDCKKIISKLLSKEKEKFILYLLEKL
jgi:ribonuclease HI